MLKQALKLLLPFFVAGLLFSACDRKKTENYGATIVHMPDRARDAAGQADLEALKSSVQAYRAANGEYPKDLKDASALLGSPVDLGKYNYDPATGAVSMKKAD